MMQYKVCVVTVTYGDRWKFLKEVLARVVSFNNVANVIVVNNAAVYSVEDNISHPKITVLNNEENDGSAGGYNKGVAYAYNNTDCDFIWLLDDDNLPAENALSELFKYWDSIAGSDIEKALFCMRPDRQTHIDIAKGAGTDRHYLVANNFLGFSVSRILKNQYLKRIKRSKPAHTFLDHIQMPYVPYGGLFIHRQMVKDIGFPNSEFFLYVDDSEYTYRITQKGGKIHLIPSATIIDIDVSQGINYQHSLFRSHLLDLWNFRTYYHIRNRVYFYSRVAVRNKFIFGVNKTLYLSWLWIVSKLSNKKDAYRKLLVAVDDGLKGKLGKADQEKF